MATQLSKAHPADRRLVLGWLVGYGLLWIWLAIEPVNRRDWLLENVLTVLAVTLLVFTYRRFQFSRLSYGLIAVFLILHAIGAHYTYAEVPSGFWLKEALDLDRNPFDRLVHGAFGALLVYPMRELLLRLAGVRGFWSYALSASVMLALSGLFEVIEAIVAMVVSPELGSLYLGTQGDEWDAQKDMTAALAGTLLTLSAIHVLQKRRAPPMPAAEQ